jgi:uncharacterized protein YqfA (UPF0365 family)
MKDASIYIALLMFLVPVGFAAVMSLVVMRPFLKAHWAGLNLTVFEVIGMKLRRLDIYQILDALILAEESGVEISHIDLQRAAMRKLDVRKLVIAYIDARGRNLDLSFEDLVECELAGTSEESRKVGI